MPVGRGEGEASWFLYATRFAFIISSAISITCSGSVTWQEMLTWSRKQVSMRVAWGPVPVSSVRVCYLSPERNAFGRGLLRLGRPSRQWGDGMVDEQHRCIDLAG